MSEPTWSRGPVTVHFGEKAGKYPDGNQVVVRGKDTLAAFDTPLVSRRLGQELAEVEMVILGHVHEDHVAGLGMLPRAAVFAPHADLPAAQGWDGLARHYGYSAPVLAEMKVKVEKEFHYSPRPDAQGYGDGRVWELGGVRVRAIHMPGHTGGHSVLLIEPEGIAFIGDIDLSGFGPYYGDACSNLADFRHSLARVAEVPAQAWITSHHKGVVTEREQFLALLRAFGQRIEAREQAMLAALGAGPRTLEELVAQRFLYPKTHRETWVDDAERMTLVQHLTGLEQAGRVAREGAAYCLTGR
jgi:glyoxylase-like metal-dependent hydrolase (beta-lactamase superfamily II)